VRSPDPRTAENGWGPLVGQIVAGHELVRLLRIGGTGEVYLARHQTLGALRAVKVIRADLVSKEITRQRFTREAQILARLQHNSIVQIIEFGALENGQPFLAMEYIEGPSLDELVERAPLPILSALVVLEQIALALHHAHSSNIIHRDLALSNVLVRSGDVRQVKMIDFGLARVLDADAARLTIDGQVIGTFAYMAPESVEGAPDVSSAVDVYALAGIAYHLISGQPPFLHKRRVALMKAQMKEQPPRLSERCPDVPSYLDELLLRCLAKDPALRPRADEVASQLGNHLRGSELVAVSVPALPRFEIVDAPWATAGAPFDLASLLLDAPVPTDPDGLGLALATKIMSMIEEIATYLSASDPELTSLLRLEARICEQIASVEHELATVTARRLSEPDNEDILKHRDALTERMRTLNAQQIPLQRTLVSVVEAYREKATGPALAVFRRMDRALLELVNLRSKSP
jgi:serine/threonine protein kinase